MGRRRTSAFEDVAEIVARLPWWVGVVLAAVFYAWFHHVATQPAPAAPAGLKNFGEFLTSQFWRTLAMFFQYILPGACLVGSAISAYRRHARAVAPGMAAPAATSRWAQGRTTAHAESAAAPLGAIPTCPVCHAVMVQRVAKKGANAGGVFWGCSKYPACRGVRNA